MAEGRLVEAVEALHERLASARRHVRGSPSTQEKESGKRRERPPGTDSGSELPARCSRCRRELGDDPFVSEEGAFCHYCEKRIKEEWKQKRPWAKPPWSEDSTVCACCRQPLEEALTEAGSAVYCTECAPEVGQVRQSGEQRAPDVRDEQTRQVDKPQPAATSQWQDEELSTLQRAVMKHLEHAYPGWLTANQMAERVRGGARFIGGVDESQVNPELYGRLSEWLEKRGDTPPHWRLRPSDRATAGRKAGPDRRASKGETEVSAEGDGGQISLPGGEPVKDAGRGAAPGSVPDEASDSSYELCSVCVTERPGEHMQSFRGRMVCRPCREELGIA